MFYIVLMSEDGYEAPVSSINGYPVPIRELAIAKNIGERFLGKFRNGKYIEHYAIMDGNGIYICSDVDEPQGELQ